MRETITILMIAGALSGCNGAANKATTVSKGEQVGNGNIMLSQEDPKKKKTAAETDTIPKIQEFIDIKKQREAEGKPVYKTPSDTASDVYKYLKQREEREKKGIPFDADRVKTEKK